MIDHRHGRERRSQRQVVRHADVRVDDVPDELRARDELRRDVVARVSENVKIDPAATRATPAGRPAGTSSTAARAQVAGRLEQRAGHPETAA